MSGPNFYAAWKQNQAQTTAQFNLNNARAAQMRARFNPVPAPSHVVIADQAAANNAVREAEHKLLNLPKD